MILICFTNSPISLATKECDDHTGVHKATRSKRKNYFTVSDLIQWGGGEVVRDSW